MRIVSVFQLLRKDKDAVIAFLLAIIYGLALPIGSLFLKNEAINQNQFLFVSQDFLTAIDWNQDVKIVSAIIYWILAMFSVSVSLAKVYKFLFTAYGNKLLALLACAAFEAAFISTHNVYCTAFFFLVVGISNVFEALYGFISDNGKAEPKEGEKFWKST